jgi:thymidylate kinase
MSSEPVNSMPAVKGTGLSDFLTDLFGRLNTRYRYAVLRNHEGLPDRLASRDIDILLAPDQLRSFQSECVKLAAGHHFRILYAHRDDQFWTIVLCNVDAEEPQLLQLDVMINLNVMGVIFLDADAALESRQFNGALYHVAAHYEFLVKFIYCRIHGTAYPAKYSDRLSRARHEDSTEVNAALRRWAGDRAADPLAFWETQPGKALLLRGLSASIRAQPLRQLASSARFLAWNVAHRFLRRGLLLSLSGPDGSGKTTLIDKLLDSFGQVNRPVLFHFRPALIPNLGELAHRARVKKAVDTRFDAPHRGSRNGILSSHVRLAYYLGDYIAGYALKVLPLLYRKQIVIFDRYFTDVIVDGERSGIFLKTRYLASLRHLVPRCTYNFLIEVDAATILQRKQELTSEAIGRIYARMRELAQRDRSYHWINNEGPPTAAAKQILSVILEHQHAYWLRRLG